MALALFVEASGDNALAQTDRGSLSVNVGDVLGVSVYGRADLSGEFPVAPDGTISLPLAGAMRAVGLPPSELSHEIEQALLQYIPGLSVSVVISKFAPVFVVGEVQSPGRYEYRPGMTALELFALAGGLRRVPAEVDTVTIQMIQARQELADTDLQIFAQQLVRGRIRAELDGTEYPATATEGGATDPALGATEQRMIASEARLFQIRKTAREAQERGILAQAASYDDEIATLTKSIGLHDQEIRLLEEDVEAQKSLVERGLTARSNLREMERLLSSTRRDALELGSFMARARQNKLALEQRRTELAGVRSDEAARQIQDIEVSIARLSVRRDGLIRAIGEFARLSSADVMADGELEPSYRIMRMVDGDYEQIGAGEQDPIRPNDILTVRLPELRVALPIQ